MSDFVQEAASVAPRSNNDATGNKEIIARAFEAWAAGTGGAFNQLAPDARWTIVGKSVVSGTSNSREDFL